MMKSFGVNRKLGGAATIGILVLSLSGCGGASSDGQMSGYPIALDVQTTLQRTVIPDDVPTPANPIFPSEIAKYPQYGYGSWQYGSGLPFEKRLDIMPDGYAASATAVTNVARLLNFFTITDIHVTDKESPVQAINFGYKGENSSAYSPVMLYTTQVLDAAVQTINALHKNTPFDFGISLGDVINNAQYNELRWYLDVIDGKNINPDSGIKDDPLQGRNNDYQDEYRAAGLDKSIPWYQVLGNHDHFWMGTYPENEKIRNAYVGDEILNMGDIFSDPLRVNSSGYYMGVLDGSTIYGDVVGTGPVENYSSPPKIPADPNRRSLSRKQWMSEFFNTSSNPVGHGFTQSNLDNDFASYSFEPKTNLPVKVIVLDDTQQTEDFNINEHGYLNQARYDWLVSELDKGQAEGKLMIIAAHIPINAFGVAASAPIRRSQLIAKLNSYPNLILWISGHRHRNVVTARPSSDGARPELGFWEVETASLRDFPQQFRLFDIVRNSDNTVSIFATNVNPAVKEGSLAAISRSYAVAALQLFKYPLDAPPSGSYNGELVKKLSTEMQAKMQHYGTPLAQ